MIRRLPENERRRPNEPDPGCAWVWVLVPIGHRADCTVGLVEHPRRDMPGVGGVDAGDVADLGTSGFTTREDALAARRGL
jgi:hypothetical protein